EREDAARKKFEAAAPAILEAAAAVIEGASMDTLAALVQRDSYGATSLVEKRFPVPESGITAEQLVRQLAFGAVAAMARNSWQAPRVMPKLAKALGLNLKALLAGSGAIVDPIVETEAPDDVEHDDGDDDVVEESDPACIYCDCTENAACVLEGG